MESVPTVFQVPTAMRRGCTYSVPAQISGLRNWRVLFQVDRRGVWFAVYRHVSELSTPFIHGRWAKLHLEKRLSWLAISADKCIDNIWLLRASLDAIGYPRSSKLFVINAILLTVVFFLVRVASIPLYYYLVYGLYVSGHSSATLGFMWYAVLYSGALIDILNIMWFRKLLLGAMKALRDLNNGKNSGTKKYQWRSEVHFDAYTVDYVVTVD